MDDQNPQIDELVTTDFETSTSKCINVLTKEQCLLVDIVHHIDNPDLKKQYFDRLTNSLNDKEKENSSKLPSTSTGCYDLTTILDRIKEKNTIWMNRQILILKTLKI